MKLVLKAAVGIYIVSVLVFSSFSKADQTDFLLSEDLYNLAVPTQPVNGLIDAVVKAEKPSAHIISNLEGDLIAQDNTLFFVSTDESVLFKISDRVIDQFQIKELPIAVNISGFYYPAYKSTVFARVNTLNVGDITLL